MSKQKIKFSYKLFNPNFWHVLDSFLNTALRFIFLVGGSSSSKTYSVVQAIIFSALKGREDTIIFRKVGASIENSIYKDFKTVIRDWNLNHLFEFKRNKIVCIANGSEIDFAGLDDSEKIKGITGYKRVVLEEVSEFELSDWKQIKKRLRGMSGQQIIALLNPISELHWVKTEVLDKEVLLNAQTYLDCVYDDQGNILPPEYSQVKEKWYNESKTVFNPQTGEYETNPPDTVVIKSTYLNNFWIVSSPDGLYGFYDRQVVADFDRDKTNDPDYYEIYALGNWGSIKTGGEFWKKFNIGKHTGKTVTDCAPVHLTIDNNVLPYISVAVWQIEEHAEFEVTKYLAKQIGEVPARDPYNTVTSASKLTAKYLKDIGHTDKVFIYGDQTTTANNTIDEEKRSFFDKYCQGIEEAGFIIEKRMPSVNPSVALSGEFVNEIYADNIPTLEIVIDECCKVSVKDYMITKQDANGGILKKRIRDKRTGQTYEESGHYSDTKRYFLCEVFKDKYTDFSLRRNRSNFKDDQMKFYTDIDFKDALINVRIVPDVNGVFSLVVSKLIEDRVYITDVIFNKDAGDSFNRSVELIKQSDPEEVTFESIPVWYEYGRNIRTECDSSSIRILTEPTKKESRILVMSGFIKSNLYFKKDYDSDPEYTAFIENLLDNYKGISIEASNILSGVAEYFKKQIE